MTEDPSVHDAVAAWQQLIAQDDARTALAAEALPANKTALFDALAAAGITSVVAAFDGYGDSGQIESIDARIGDAAAELPTVEIEIATPAWDGSELHRRTLPLSEAINQLAYDFLSETQGGGRTTRERMANSPSTSPSGRSISITTSGSKARIIPATTGEEAAMGHPYHHALSSARKWGGTADDYLPLHAWFDEPSKLIIADFRHRALRHHAEGVFGLERAYGTTITISTGRVVPVRLIGEQHCIEDLGFIPSFADWVCCIRPEPWMGRAQPIHRDLDPFVTQPAGDGLPSSAAQLSGGEP